MDPKLRAQQIKYRSVVWWKQTNFCLEETSQYESIRKMIFKIVLYMLGMIYDLVRNIDVRLGKYHLTLFDLQLSNSDVNICISFEPFPKISYTQVMLWHRESWIRKLLNDNNIIEGLTNPKYNQAIPS